MSGGGAGIGGAGAGAADPAVRAGLDAEGPVVLARLGAADSAARAALGAAGLVAVSFLARSPEVSAAERWAFELVGRLPPRATPALWVVMQAGSLPAVFVFAGLALTARRHRLALAIVTSGTTAWLAAKPVKRVVDRERPSFLLQDVAIYGKPSTGLGYPSGHAAVAAAMMTAAAPCLPRPARIVGWSAVAAVATARMVVGAHLPLDAAGGLLLGWTAGNVARTLSRLRRVPPALR